MRLHAQSWVSAVGNHTDQIGNVQFLRECVERRKLAPRHSGRHIVEPDHKTRCHSLSGPVTLETIPHSFIVAVATLLAQTCRARKHRSITDKNTLRNLIKIP
jgi:hypothetical protein